jgi:hypothetical protein
MNGSFSNRSRFPSTAIALWLLLLCLSPVICLADDGATDSPESTPSVVLDINLHGVVGLLENSRLLSQMLVDAIDDDRIQTLEDGIAKANEIIGMDVRSDVGIFRMLVGPDVTLDNLKDMQVRGIPLSAALTTTRAGNLQGLLLMSPNYSSTEDGENTLHKIDLDGSGSIFIRFVEANARFLTVAAFDESDLSTLAQTVADDDSMSFLNNDNRLVRIEIGVSAMSTLKQKIPNDSAPPVQLARNITKDITGLVISVERQGEGLSLTATSTLTSDKKAQQQAQAIRGAIALAQLVLGEETDEEIRFLLSILDKARVDLTNNQVTLGLEVDSLESLFYVGGFGPDNQ